MVELVVGVRLGALVADLLVSVIGSGWWQITLIVDDAGTVVTVSHHDAAAVPHPADRGAVRVDRGRPGPYGAESMSEAPGTPVAPASANAIRDAIGVRPHELPMSPGPAPAAGRSPART